MQSNCKVSKSEDIYMAQFKKIGVLTSGGDAPGMNAVIRAIVNYASQNDVEVVGIYEGYRGLLDNDTCPLQSRDVANSISRGGTILYTARCDKYNSPEGVQAAYDRCKELGIDGIIAIGGDGTFRGATDLAKTGIPTIGIPGTIDNDITATDYTVGYDTAMNTVVEMCDRLRDTCESHARCDIVEVMGRNAGYIALNAGIAVGATAILLKEFEYDEDAIIEKMIAERKSNKARSFIIVMSEGLDGYGFGDYGEELAKKIEAKSDEEGCKIETRFARLAHVVRGGNPTLRDRLAASRMGAEAVRLLLEGKSNLVVCERDGKITTSEIKYALALDKMFKNEYAFKNCPSPKYNREKNLEGYGAEDIKKMEAYCEKKYQELKDLYKVANTLAFIEE